MVALVLAGLLGGELYARNRADSIVTKATECVVQDGAKASFGVVPPFLWQHMSGHYTNIHIETAGNQVRRGQGHEGQPSTSRTSGWRTPRTPAARSGRWSRTSTGRPKASSRPSRTPIPLVGSFVTGVTTNPSAGTIELQGALGSITAKPQVVDGGSALQVTELTGLGFTLPRETVQPALDAFTIAADRRTIRSASMPTPFRSRIAVW